METFQMFQNTEILDSWPSRSRNAISRLGIVFDCKQLNKATPIFLRTFQIVSKQEFLLRPLVCEKSGEFEAPMERRNIQNSNQVPVDCRISQGLNIQTTDFCREMVSICVLKPYDSQTTATYKRTDPFQDLARISQIPKRHVWTRNRSPFQLQIDLAPKSRYWPPWMSRLRFLFVP